MTAALRLCALLCLAAVGSAQDVPNTSTPSSTTSGYLRPTNIPPVAPTICEDGIGWLMIPDPTDCRRFIVCLDSQTWIMNCPAPLFFSYQQQRCEWPNESGCVQPTTTTTTSTTQEASTENTSATPDTSETPESTATADTEGPQEASSTESSLDRLRHRLVLH